MQGTSFRQGQQQGKSGKFPNPTCRMCCMNCGGTNAGFPKTNPMGPKYVWVPKNKT